MPARSTKVITGEKGVVADYGCLIGRGVARVMTKVFEKGRLEAEASGVMNPEVVITRGRTYTLARKTAFFGDEGTSYTYAGVKRNANAWDKGTMGRALVQIREFLDVALDDADKIDGVFAPSYALVNYYPDGGSALGAHSDDDRDLEPCASIVSVSFGATRDMVFIEKGDDKTRIVVPLVSGSVISMRPPLQRNWKHEIPKRARVKEGRFNVTFRTLVKE